MTGWNPIDSMKYIEEQGDKGRQRGIAGLLGQAYAQPEQRAGLLGKVAMAGAPDVAMQAEQSFGKQADDRMERFVKRLPMVVGAYKGGNPQLAQSLWSGLHAQSPFDIPLPPQIDDEGVMALEQIIQMTREPKELPSSYQEYQLSQKDPGFMPFLQQKTLMTRPPQVGNINGTPIWIGPEGYREVPAAGAAGPQPMGTQPTGPKDEDAIYAKANEMSQAGMPPEQVEAWLNQQLSAEVILPGPQTAQAPQGQQADIYSQPQPPITAPPKVKQAWPFLRPEQRRQVLEQESGIAPNATGDAPSGYQWNADRSSLVPIPGGPADRKNNPAPSDQAKGEMQLRKEVSDRVKESRTVMTMYQKVQAAASAPTAANDLAMIFGYMKMLDPGSVVREQEFANAQNAAGVPDQVRNLYNKVKAGERLNPNQRRQFLSSAAQIANVAQQQISAVAREYQDMADQYGYDATRATGMADFRGVQSGASPSKGLPRPQTEAEFNALPSGATYIDPDDGKTYRKP